QRLEWVRGAKEASTLMAELDLARTVLAKEEAEFMRSGDAVGEAERKAAEAENALQKLRDSQAAERESIAGRRQERAAEGERGAQGRGGAAHPGCACRDSGTARLRLTRFRQSLPPP